MVEWDGLENRCGLRSTEGSNPSLPASGKRVHVDAFFVSTVAFWRWNERSCWKLKNQQDSFLYSLFHHQLNGISGCHIPILIWIHPGDDQSQPVEICCIHVVNFEEQKAILRLD